MSWNAHSVIRETEVHAARDRGSKDAISQLDEIVENAVLLDTVVSIPSSKSKMKNTAFMHSFYAVFNTGKETHVLKLFAEMALNNKEDTVFTRAYQLKDIKKVAVLGNGVSGANAPLSGANTATIKSIADLVGVVKQYDPEYNPNPKFIFYTGHNISFRSRAGGGCQWRLGCSGSECGLADAGRLSGRRHRGGCCPKGEYERTGGSGGGASRADVEPAELAAA